MSLLQKRESFVYWTPAIVGAVVSLPIFDGHIASRVLYAAGFGVFFQLFSMLGYVTVLYFVTRIAGDRNEPVIPNRHDRQLTTALVMVALVYGLGLYWKEKEARKVLRCAGDSSAMMALGKDATPQDLVRYCVEDYDRNSSGGSYDE
jgi:hypothetical protein